MVAFDEKSLHEENLKQINDKLLDQDIAVLKLDELKKMDLELGMPRAICMAFNVLHSCNIQIRQVGQASAFKLLREISFEWYCMDGILYNGAK